MSFRSIALASALVTSVACFAGCTASVDNSDEASTRSSEALVTCGFNQVPDCTNETVGGRPVCGCDDLAAPGVNPNACSGTIPVPSGLAGKGCTRGTWIWLPWENQVPMWECPVTASIPPALGVVGGGTIAACTWVNGVPQVPADGTPCAATTTTHTIDDSCVGNPPDGWMFVIEQDLWHWPHKEPIGTNCGGGCSRICSGC
jgi:hypothetical protein